MGNLEVEFAGVRFRNPLILASATPGWDGERSNQAWRAGAGGVVPKSFAPPVKWTQHPRCGRMKLIKHGKNRIGMVNIELYTTMALQDWLDNELDKAFEDNNSISASVARGRVRGNERTQWRESGRVHRDRQTRGHS